jgi:hypothetical protein
MVPFDDSVPFSGISCCCWFGERLVAGHLVVIVSVGGLVNITGG